MDTIDPTTGRPLPPDSIQRVLFISPKVHVYNPPPPSQRGHIAATWTNPSRQIFTARLRILETAIPTASGDEKVKTDILMEDPASGDLFAAAPYTAAAVVEQVTDSSRFFAIRVQDPQGRKATLGIGFEERSEAFDFSVSLQEVRKALGLETGAPGARMPAKENESKVERDFSLKDGQTITVNLGNKMGKGRRVSGSNNAASGGGGFSLPPPPSGGAFLPPPPSAQEVKAQKRLSQTPTPEQKSIEDLGFDDGEFGEFQ
jgi:hypothetical protein